MSENTVTAPGKATVMKVTTAPSAGNKTTVFTSVAEFNKIKSLLSNKPLRPPARPAN